MARSPEVGIVYVLHGRLFIEATPLADAADYGDFKIHERDHIQYWNQLARAGAVPPDCEYEEFPRGRANFNTKTGRYALYLDRCILRSARTVAKIMSKLNLPPEHTMADTDPHYVCFRCLRRRGASAHD